jgi:phage/plasmid primase-like uncharacterized protein
MAVVAFDCGNLLAVAEVWPKKLPKARIMICADADKAGLEIAYKAARASSCSTCHRGASRP